jgi:hypothetical protein
MLQIVHKPWFRKSVIHTTCWPSNILRYSSKSNRLINEYAVLNLTSHQKTVRHLLQNLLFIQIAEKCVKCRSIQEINV